MVKDLKTRIIEATIDLGAQEGLSKVSNVLIANKCGVTSAALYYHFKDKYELIWTSTNYVSLELSNLTANETTTFAEKYKEFLRITYNYLMENKNKGIFYTRALMASDYIFKREDMLKIRDHCPFCELISEGVENNLLKNIGIPYMTLAFYPLLNYAYMCNTKNINATDAEINALFSGMWDAIKL